MLTCTSPILIREGREIMQYPCRKCLQCKKNIANMWTERIKMESTNKEAFFLTLTYDNDHLPDELDKPALQKFIKRYRKRLGPDLPIKYFACGEYGGKTLRPHYHLIIIGFFPKDLWQLSIGKFSSKLVNECWKFGSNEIGTCEERSIRYVTGYVIKEKHKGEFRIMSKGIGEKYLEQHALEIFRRVESGKEKTGRYINDKIKIPQSLKNRNMVEDNEKKIEEFKKLFNIDEKNPEFWDKYIENLYEKRKYRDVVSKRKNEIYNGRKKI